MVKINPLVKKQLPFTVPDVFLSLEICMLRANGVEHWSCQTILLDFSLSVKAAPHECVIRTSQP